LEPWKPLKKRPESRSSVTDLHWFQCGSGSRSSVLIIQIQLTKINADPCGSGTLAVKPYLLKQKCGDGRKHGKIIFNSFGGRKTMIL
jgi:hypothetical protein